MRKLLPGPFILLFLLSFSFIQGQQIRQLDKDGSYELSPATGVRKSQVPYQIDFQGKEFEALSVEVTPQLPHSGIIRMIQEIGQINMRIPGLSDDRNLPLSPNGKLLSVGGFEVEFKLPNNPNDPGGICGTPVPEVILPPNSRMPANCPFVVPCDQAVNRNASIPTSGQAIKYIKLNWTVVRNGGASTNISQVRIDQLMTELNNDFSPYYIQFCADPATFVEDAALYNLNVGSEDATLKTTYGVTPNLVCNVYVVNNITNPSAGGYARFPYDPFGGYNIRGGVVMGRSNSNLGTHTLAHELGHTFGLHHTFRGVDEVTPCTACYEGNDNSPGPGQSIGGDTEGDWCQDTPPHPTNSYICGDAGTDGCAPFNAWSNSPVNNHMSYSFCTSTFTNQQAGRFHCMIDSYLSNWVSYGGGTCGAQPPTALFTGNPTTWQAPSLVTFTDQSIPSTLITSWTWDFDVTGIGGATPATFIGQNPPVVRYDSCDTSYSVRLIVSNANGADTLTRLNYINVTCPAGECDTLDQHWINPTPTFNAYTFGPNNYVTGVPSATLQPVGFYERYVTPSPGTTTVGAVKVALASFLDADSSMRIQFSIYNDSSGFPVGAPLGGRGGLEPGGDLGIPGGNFYGERWVPFFNKVTIDSPAFHVGMEIFNNGPGDRLVLMSSANGQGQNAGLNNVLSVPFGFANYNTFIGVDFDLHLIPMLGEWPAQPVPAFSQLVGCDTTLLIVVDTVLFSSCITNMTVEFQNLGVTVSDTDITNLDTLFALYTGPGPETVTFTTINNCGRTDTASFLLNYTFRTSPVADFSFSPPNPVCAGAPGVTFTASPTGMANYLWDFGDGTTASSGASNTTTHIYTTPGRYYVSVTVTDANGCTDEEIKLDIIEIVDCSVNAPIAGFRQFPDSACIGETISFIDTSQAVPNPPTTWQWDFGDGNFSLNQNPSHSYTSAGTFIVRLVAGNSGGNDTAYYSFNVTGPCPLPFGVSLAASSLEQAIALSWSTSTENSNLEFYLERASATSGFQTIHHQSDGDVQNGKRFSFLDRNVDPETEYLYRVRQVDPNGNTEFSNIARGRLTESIDWVSIYPNPTEQGQYLNIDAVIDESGEVQVEIFDLLGRALTTLRRSSGPGMVQFEIDTQTLPKGNYFVKVSTLGKVEVKRYVVK